jgi:hypothetical protein
MMCVMCSADGAFICRIRDGFASYYCVECMNAVRDSPGGVLKGDIWLSAVASEWTTESPE